jgi:hypothetical protein
VSPSTIARCGRRERAELEAVDEADVGGLARPERRAQPGEVAAVQPDAIDHAGRVDVHGHALGAGDDRAVQLLARRGSTCFESFSSASGRTRWSRSAS